MQESVDGDENQRRIHGPCVQPGAGVPQPSPSEQKTKKEFKKKRKLYFHKKKRNL